MNYTTKIICAMGLVAVGLYGTHLGIDGAGWVIAVGLIAVLALYDFV